MFEVQLNFQLTRFRSHGNKLGLCRRGARHGRPAFGRITGRQDAALYSRRPACCYIALKSWRVRGRQPSRYRRICHFG